MTDEAKEALKEAMKIPKQWTYTENEWESKRAWQEVKEKAEERAYRATKIAHNTKEKMKVKVNNYAK